MNRKERQQLSLLISEVRGSVQEALDTVNTGKSLLDAAKQEAIRIHGRLTHVGLPGQPGDLVAPLGDEELQAVEALAALEAYPVPTKEDCTMVGHLTSVTSDTATAAARALRRPGFLTGRAKKQAAAVSIGRLTEEHKWATSPGVQSRLIVLCTPSTPNSYNLDDLLEPRLRFLELAGHDGENAVVIQLPRAGDTSESIKTITNSVAQEQELATAAKQAGAKVREHDTALLLSEMPIDALRKATNNRLRMGPLTDHGIATVLDVLKYAPRIPLLDGVGEATATGAVAAARTLWNLTYEETPIRFDLKARRTTTTDLLERLRAWDSPRRIRLQNSDFEDLAALAPVASRLGWRHTHALLLSDDPQNLVNRLDRTVEVARQLKESSPSNGDPWDDFQRRPADYFTMLAELGFVVEDHDAAHGDLPDEIIEAVQRQELKTDLLRGSLRGYQHFAARFALVQRKVIIGDEMGLGKTFEALAVLAHLRSTGNTHFLVVCPAAVVTNWMREIASKSALSAHRLHGNDRASGLKSWRRSGGVAVTTYDSLRWLAQDRTGGLEIEAVVVDEAHYIKNHDAQRSQRCADLIDSANRAILLTGTPLENRVEEFRNLVDYVRPDLVVDASDFSPRRFRRQIAPAYLRRNQEDVLKELPGLIEVEEWLPMSPPDRAAYKQAVFDGNFMAMRQAALLTGPASQKLERLIEIVDEAEQNGRRVIVFSYFRQVLDDIVEMLPGQVFGPLTGSVGADFRQAMVDQFSESEHGAVLVAQIVAGGVGLNIQAASVVVICEPQLKPTTESQAIARAHRMGQIQSVQVFRLYSDEGVDLRLHDILAEKQRIFDEFARVSETADSTPEARDISEADLARTIIAEESMRLAGADRTVDAEPIRDIDPVN